MNELEKYMILHRVTKKDLPVQCYISKDRMKISRILSLSIKSLKLISRLSFKCEGHR